ncbi:MAG: DHH family phosphoesterase [Candidatus Micrarchaeia archaeon]
MEASKGIVTSVKRAANPVEDEYCIINASTSYCTSQGFDADYAIGKTASEEAKRRAEMLINSISGKVYDGSNKQRILQTYSNGHLKAVSGMIGILDQSAIILAKKIVSGAPVVVRYHNDGDGASGAVALYKAISQACAKNNIREHFAWRMNRSIAYGIDELYEDMVYFGNFESLLKPTLIMIDFGTSPESEESVKKAAKNYDIIWLDHHVPYSGFEKIKPQMYANPWEHGGDSNFTAGALGAIFGELISGLDLSIFQQASFISDFSEYAIYNNTEKAEKIAVALDYITSSKKSSKQPSIQYIEQSVTEEEKLESIYRNAKNLMAEAISKGIEAVHSYKAVSGIGIHVVDFNDIASDVSEYPLPGRFSSALQRKFEEIFGPRTITLVHFGSFISIRLSKSISNEIDILGKIRELERSTKGMISGGGHSEAASIRTARDNMANAIDMLLGMLGVHK